MTWVRIDDAAPIHPKQLSVGPAAAWLWVCGIAHCNRHTTDGEIKKSALSSLYPSDEWTRADQKRGALRLVEAGMWIDEGAVWRVHNYAEYQEEALKVNVQERREREKQRKREERERKKLARLNKVSQPDVLRAESRTDAANVNGQPAPRPDVSQVPGPAQPNPAQPVPSSSLFSSEDSSTPTSPENNCGLPAAASIGRRISELEARYPAGLAGEVRTACALSRKNGRMTDSCWLQALTKLAAFKLEASVYAMRLFIEKYADGSRQEEYMIGIARKYDPTKCAQTRMPNGKHAGPSDVVTQEQLIADKAGTW